MRKRQMKWLWKRLRELVVMEISREEMLMKPGAARCRAPGAWRLVDIEMEKESSMFIDTLNRQEAAPGPATRRAVFAAHQPHRK